MPSGGVLRPLAIASLGLWSATGLAATDSADVDLTAERAGIEQFQDLDQKLHDVGWRLAHGNAAFCAQTIQSIGLQLQDLASYGGPDIARAALGLSLIHI